jgi:rRNA maturation protein Rpf1
MLLTTSRRPSDELRTFCRDLSNTISDLTRVNRGKMSLDGVAEKAIELEADHVIVVDRWNKGVGQISLFTLRSNGLAVFAPQLLLSNILLRRDFGQPTRRKATAVTMDSKDFGELETVGKRFSEFFGLPLLTTKQAYREHNVSLHLMLDSSKRLRVTFIGLERMVELGPQVTVSKLVWDV